MSQLQDSGFPCECEQNYEPDGASLSHHLQQTVPLVLPRLYVGSPGGLQGSPGGIQGVSRESPGSLQGVSRGSPGGTPENPKVWIFSTCLIF